MTRREPLDIPDDAALMDACAMEWANELHEAADAWLCVSRILATDQSSGQIDLATRIEAQHPPEVMQAGARYLHRLGVKP